MSENAIASASRRSHTSKDAEAPLDPLLGHSPAIERLRAELVIAGSRRSGAQLVLGELGTEKELVARAIHMRSARREGPFLAVMPTALADEALRTELFAQAETGTLFVEEVRELGEDARRAILVSLAEERLHFIGGSAALEPADELLEVLLPQTLTVPPLRERREDVPLLARSYAHAAGLAVGRSQLELNTAVTDRLLGLDWPGNTRQLQSVVEDAVERAGRGPVKPEHLRLEHLAHFSVDETGERLGYSQARRALLHNFERRYLEDTLRIARGNLSLAARASGIDRANLRRMLKAHGLYLGAPPPAGAPVNTLRRSGPP